MENMLMAKLNTQWIVQPHRGLICLTDGIYTVEGSIVMPLGRFPRRMTVLRLRDGGSAIWSPIPLREQQMSRLEGWGPVRFLIVPNRGHRLDIAAWKNRYPQARIIAPPAAKAGVDIAAPVDATHDIIGDPQISFHLIAGTRADEFAMIVARPDVRRPQGLGASLMASMLGFGVKRPRTSWPFRRRFVKDPAAMARQFHAWSSIEDLRRIIVSHGDVIDQHPRDALTTAASDFE
jgi:hypothetical protein